MNKYYYEYYKIKLNLRETFENVVNIDTGNYNLNYFELSETSEAVLKEVYDPIKKLLFLFRNDYQQILNLISIIDKNFLGENMNTLVDLICHQFYENLLIQNPENEELLVLCYLLLEKEIDNMNSASVSSFLDEATSFIGKLLKSYNKKQELKTYLTSTLGSLVLRLENSNDGCLDLDLSRISNYINYKKTNQVVNKSYTEEKTRSIMGIDNENLTKQIPRSTLSHRMSVKSNKSRDSKILDNITYSIKEGITINTQGNDTNPSKNFFPQSSNNEFFLELVENVGELKYEDGGEYNSDYMIEMTQDELSSRLLSSTDENMKEFCMISF